MERQPLNWHKGNYPAQGHLAHMVCLLTWPRMPHLLVPSSAASLYKARGRLRKMPAHYTPGRLHTSEQSQV